MDDSGVVETQFLESAEIRGSNTEINNTEYSDTDPFLSADRNEGMREHAQYESYFRESLYFDILLQEHRFDEETLEGILDLLVDTCCSKRKTIRIAGDDKPIEVVKSRFMKLNSMHIEYVMDCLKNNPAKVRNIKQYLLATLYNAPITLQSYYQAWVNNDMAEGRI